MKNLEALLHDLYALRMDITTQLVEATNAHRKACESWAQYTMDTLVKNIDYAQTAVTVLKRQLKETDERIKQARALLAEEEGAVA